MGWKNTLIWVLQWFFGVYFILGGLGLILPSVTRIQPQLTVYAAAGLVLVMIGAAVFHVNRGEGVSIAQNVIIGALLAFIGYGRRTLYPIQSRE
ncbi:MAG: DoxX family protein [Actinomycetia bacterium]|nr:DoxX family protein [Actinomycetes bacterium]